MAAKLRTRVRIAVDTSGQDEYGYYEGEYFEYIATQEQFLDLLKAVETRAK